MATVTLTAEQRALFRDRREKKSVPKSSLGIALGTVDDIETGSHRHMPWTLVELARALGMTPDELRDAGLPEIADSLASRLSRSETRAVPADGGEPPAPDPAGSCLDEAEREILAELRLCKALAALDPPHLVAAAVHKRITKRLEELRVHGTVYPDARTAGSLTSEELRQAAGVLRGICDLPSWADGKGSHRPGSFRATLSGYALDLAAEMSRRAGLGPGPAQ